MIHIHTYKTYRYTYHTYEGRFAWADYHTDKQTDTHA